jgi:LmbE family N-acetylglucosaminyl deacetylase
MRLLCVTAHPDDEAGSFGGSLSLYHDRGVETHVICLTAGQAATHRGGAQSDADLAALRRHEFAESCKILHVSNGEILDYPDGQLQRMDLYRVVEALAQRIRSIRPHVMLTFGSEGAITGHPDHSMASIFGSMAFHWAARTDRYREQLNNGLRPHRTQKLYYATAGFTLPERQPVSLPPTTTVIEIGKYLERKISAFRAHKSQAPLFPIFEGMVRQRGSKEMFHLASAITPRNVEMEDDLLTGVKDE